MYSSQLAPTCIQAFRLQNALDLYHFALERMIRISYSHSKCIGRRIELSEFHGSPRQGKNMSQGVSRVPEPEPEPEPKGLTLFGVMGTTNSVTFDEFKVLNPESSHGKSSRNSWQLKQNL